MDLLSRIQDTLQSRIKGLGWEEVNDCVIEGERDDIVDVLGEPGVDDPDSSKLSCMTWTDGMAAKLFSPRALREMLVNGPLREFNRPEFFMAIQLAVLLYYPSIALGIMYQTDTMQPTEEQIEQMMQCSDTQFTVTQSSIEQFVRMIQSIISRMTTQQAMIRKSTLSKMAMAKQAVVTDNKMDTMMMMKGNGEGMRVEVMIKVADHGTSGEGRQEERTTVWNTVYITF